MFKPFAFLISLIIFGACSTLKTVKLMKAGTVKQKAFKVEVPFEMRMGLIILKVNVNGTPADFMLDTGAPNVISNELAQKLNLAPAVSQKAGDSQGNKSSLGFVSVANINIGGLDFTETGTAIANLKQSVDIACLKIDGLIGANLMRKAIWQFDYEKKIITITSSRDSLTIPSSATSIKFKPAITGTPKAEIQLNGVTETDITIDLGSNGDFSLSMNAYKKLAKNKTLSTTYSYGSESSGLYGTGAADTTKYALISDISMGSLALHNVPVAFTKSKAKTIGTHFFKNYQLVFDWGKNEFILIPVKTYTESENKIFKFKRKFDDQKVIIGLVFEDSAAGVKLGDRVLEVDGKDYRNCDAEKCWCDITTVPIENESVSVLLLRDGKEVRLTINKELLFKAKN